MSGEGPPVPDRFILDDDQELDDYIQDWKDSLKKGTEQTGNAKFVLE